MRATQGNRTAAMSVAPRAAGSAAPSIVAVSSSVTVPSHSTAKRRAATSKHSPYCVRGRERRVSAALQKALRALMRDVTHLDGLARQRAPRGELQLLWRGAWRSSGGGCCGQCIDQQRAAGGAGIHPLAAGRHRHALHACLCGGSGGDAHGHAGRHRVAQRCAQLCAAAAPMARRARAGGRCRAPLRAARRWEGRRPRFATGLENLLEKNRHRPTHRPPPNTYGPR